MDKDSLESLGCTFPSRINVILCREKSGEYSISFGKFKKDKVKLANIKFDSTRILFFDGTITTSLGVYDFETFDEFQETIAELKKKWLPLEEEN